MSEEDELEDRIHHLLTATVSEENEDFDPGDPDEEEPQYITHGESNCGQDDWREDVYTSIRSRVTCERCKELMLDQASNSTEQSGQ
jgi:hypothetical protein